MSLFICQFCGRESTNKRSIATHQSFCKLNPERSEFDHSSAGRKGGLKSKEASKEARASKHNLAVSKYEEAPKKCRQCGISIPYLQSVNIFCGSSCSATYNNASRDYTVVRPGPKPGVQKPPSGKKILQFKVVIARNRCVICNKTFWRKGNHTHYKSCSKKCRNLIYSKVATENPKMGGNKNNKAWGWYESPIAGRVWLESSWEYTVAKSLDEHNISWTRPKFLKYDNRRYYPDFFLPDYDVYLDPKNPFLQIKDAEKIRKVEEQNAVRVLMLSKDELAWENILHRICPSSTEEVQRSCKPKVGISEFP